MGNTGILDVFKNIGKKTDWKGMPYADYMSGGTPIFSQFGTDIYASDVVQQAIRCIVQEMKKLNPTHIREKGNDITLVNESVQRILEFPNELMTKSDFIEKTMWILFLNYNVFIYPMYEWRIAKKGERKKEYVGIYPLNPTQVDFLQADNGKIFVKMRFQSSYEITLQYEDLIHLRYNYSLNDYMGGNDAGQPDNGALLKTLQINDDLLKGIAKAMAYSCQINGVVKHNTMMDKDGKLKKAIEDFEKKLKNSESGFLPIDAKADVVPFDRKIQLIDATTLKFIDEKILRNFGVPLPILTGDFTKEQYQAFYQKTLEPLIISMSDAFTKILFTLKERSHGNRIKFYPKDLIFMSVEQTIEMVRLLGDSGSVYENEKRSAFGMMPLKELEGVRMQSLNYVNVEIAQEYQLKEKSTSVNVNQGGKKDGQ